jgi:hypothetical protein
VPEIVDVLASLVTQFPSFLSPLSEFAEVVIQAVEDVGSLVDAETDIAKAADALVRAGLSEVLVRHQPAAALVEIEGRRYKRVRDASRGTYFGLRGAMTVERYLYREVGVHNGPTVVPLELNAGLVDGLWTPLAAAAAGHLLQDEPSRDAVATCRALQVMPYSRSSLERGGDRLGERWEQIRPAAEDQLAADFELPEEATTVSVSFDRVAVPMEEPILDERGGPVLGESGRVRVQVVYRMAYCGIWTLHDADGDPLYSCRYGRMAAEGHQPIEETLWGDLESLKTARPELRLVGLADGAPEMQYMLDRTVGVFGDDVEIAIDFWHVVEKVAGALRALGLDSSDWLPRVRRMLLEEERGAERVCVILRSWAVELDGDLPEALMDAITYLDRNANRMRYSHLRAKGLPIGSGHVEATCKTLVSTRMKRCGARWKTAGGQAVLSLRSLAKSSRWDAAMAIVLPTWRRPVREVA